MRRKTLPNVPAKTDQGTRPLLDALKEIVETGEGVRGDPLDRKLTLRDLIESGIAQLKRGATGGRGGIGPGFGAPPPNMATPPKPRGLVAAGSFDGEIILTWSIAQDDYGNHAFTNIYRSEVDNFANAELVGREVGFIHTDYVRNDALSPADPTQLKGYFYWITFTSTSGVEGPPNSGNGTYAEPIPDIKYLLQLLGDSLNDEPATLGSEDETLILHAKRFAIRSGPEGDLFYPLIIAEVGGVQTVVIDTALIRSGSIQEGQLGPITIGKLKQVDGSPLTTISGLIRAEAIDADNLRVAEAAKFYGNVSSGNYSPGTAGWSILQNGNVEFNQGTFNGQVEFKNVTGTDRVVTSDTFGSKKLLNTQNAIITASSGISYPGRITDGVKAISSTYWNLAQGQQYLQADLRSVVMVGESRAFFYARDGRRYRYALAVSETGANGSWTWIAGSGSNGIASSYVWSRPTRGGSHDDGMEFPTIDGIGRPARYVRLFMSGSTSNNGNHGYEWELWSHTGGEDPYSEGMARMGQVATSNWTRPGTTLISGNQIFTGDAYVDTLQIKGQAVTVPVSTQSNGNTLSVHSKQTSTTYSGWQNIQDLGVNGGSSGGTAWVFYTFGILGTGIKYPDIVAGVIIQVYVPQTGYVLHNDHVTFLSSSNYLPDSGSRPIYSDENGVAEVRADNGFVRTINVPAGANRTLRVRIRWRFGSRTGGISGARLFLSGPRFFGMLLGKR